MSSGCCHHATLKCSLCWFVSLPLTWYRSSGIVLLCHFCKSLKSYNLGVVSHAFWLRWHFALAWSLCMKSVVSCKCVLILLDNKGVKDVLRINPSYVLSWSNFTCPHLSLMCLVYVWLFLIFLYCGKHAVWCEQVQCEFRVDLSACCSLRWHCDMPDTEEKPKDWNIWVVTCVQILRACSHPTSYSPPPQGLVV